MLGSESLELLKLGGDGVLYHGFRWWSEGLCSCSSLEVIVSGAGCVCGSLSLLLLGTVELELLLEVGVEGRLL